MAKKKSTQERTELTPGQRARKKVHDRNQRMIEKMRRRIVELEDQVQVQRSEIAMLEILPTEEAQQQLMRWAADVVATIATEGYGSMRRMIVIATASGAVTLIFVGWLLAAVL